MHASSKQSHLIQWLPEPGDSWEQNLVTLDDDEDAAWLVQMVFSILLYHASAFSRRVLEPIEKFPFKLLLLAKQPDNAACAVRKQVANEVLCTEDDKLEINARKLKKLFGQELETSSQTGLLTGRLRVCMRVVSKRWRADTRECERVNKMLNLFVERSPGASYELQSSRACLKHFLGEAENPGVTDRRRKWSQYKPTAQRLLHLCASSWPDRQEVQNCVSRWSAPVVPERLESDLEISRIFDDLFQNPKQSASGTWAACYNMMLNKKLAEIPASECPTPVINFTVKDAESSQCSFSYFISVDKVRTTRRLVPCVKRNSNELWLQNPLIFRNSIQVILSFWDAIKAGSVVKVFILRPARLVPGRFVLPFVGEVSGRPELAITLEPPPRKTKTTKTTKSEGSDGEPSGSDRGEEDGEPDLYQQALDILMEEAEQFDAEHSCSGLDGDTDNECDEIQAERAVRHALLESSAYAVDHLDVESGDLENEANEELMEDAIREAGCQTAKNALMTGVCPVPSPSHVSNFLSGDEIAEEAVTEAVLNHAGHTG